MRWIRRSVLLALLVVVFAGWAAPADAAGLTGQLVDKAKLAVALLILVFVACQIGFVYGFAKLIGLPGGVFTSIMAGVFGLIAAVVIALPVALASLFLPQAVASVMMTGVGMVGGGFGVKLAFGTEFNKGLLVYLLAVTTTTVVLVAALFVIF
jgi:hypothetical protein